MTRDLREALEEQVEEWREKANGPEGVRYKNGVRDGIEKCINDIEELLQESENE